MSDTNMNNGITKVYASQDWVKENTVKSWNELEDRPFWEDEPVETVLFEGTVSNDAEIDNFALVASQEYTVTLDGVEYILTAWEGDGAVVVGSESLWWGEDYVDTEPPFVLGDGWFYTVNEGEQHTLKVVGEVKEVHQLDKKYIPTHNVLYDADTGENISNNRNINQLYIAGVVCDNSPPPSTMHPTLQAEINGNTAELVFREGFLANMLPTIHIFVDLKFDSSDFPTSDGQSWSYTTYQNFWNSADKAAFEDGRFYLLVFFDMVSVPQNYRLFTFHYCEQSEDGSMYKHFFENTFYKDGWYHEKVILNIPCNADFKIGNNDEPFTIEEIEYTITKL